MTVARTKRREFVSVKQPSGDYSGLIDAVIEIGMQRRKIVVAMKEALLRGDDREALELARELTGLPRLAQ
jgi:hypothetical protein